ncbi:MAG: TraB/GumN family protein [Muribaculaceae bacterium]|nr:TraB/GumN family protein [Muribaculaceae bacterium]
MKKTFSALKATALASLAAFAITTTASAQILYKIEKPGSDKTSYILGTHHFSPLSTVDCIEELPAIIKSVDKVYGELDMSVMKDPAALMSMQQKMMAQPDSTLTKLLKQEQLDSITTAWSTYVGDPSQLQMILPMVKPAVISTALAAGMSAKALPDYNPQVSIDGTMQERAAEAGKTVAGLETMDYQISMLYDSPISEQLESLMKTIANAEEENSNAVALCEAYKNHDIDALYKIISEATKETPESLDKMIYVRNDNWVKQLSEEMPGTSLLIVVGAGHLPGERGVLEGLKKAGFSVTGIN